MIKSKNSRNGAGHPEVALLPASGLTVGKSSSLPEPVSPSLSNGLPASQCAVRAEQVSTIKMPTTCV